MEYGLLFKKTSTCYKNPDIEYLDETSDYKLRILVKQGKITEEEFRQKHDELERSISYLTKEKHGRVYAGGFIRDALLSKKATAPEKWTNEARKKAISSVIYKHLKHFGTYRKALGHKMVFSVSEDLAQRVEDSGLNLDNILGREVKKIMYEFQHKFHRGEKIGFAWGIHHDTDNRHVHVYLCNRTDKGKHVALSNPLKGKTPEPGRKDQIGYMKERCVAAQKRILKQVQLINSHEPARQEDIKIERNPSRNLSEDFAQKDQELEQQYQALIEEENLLKLKHLEINRFYTDYHLRKELISQGWEDVKKVSAHINENYQSLRQSESIISTELLRQLGMLSCSPSIRQFSNLVLHLQRIREQERREKVLEDIAYDKEMKKQIINQIKILDWHDTVCRERAKTLKEEQKAMRESFYQRRRDYEDENLKFNYEFVQTHIISAERRELYRTTVIKLWEKRKQKVDSSSELELIRKIDKEAREEALRLKNEQEEIEEKRSNSVQNLDNNEVQNPKDRGVKF